MAPTVVAGTFDHVYTRTIYLLATYEFLSTRMAYLLFLFTFASPKKLHFKSINFCEWIVLEFFANGRMEYI